MRFARSILLTLAAIPLACSPERPPSAEDDRPRTRAEPAEAEPIALDAMADQFVLTYAGERGEFADCKTIAEVPEGSRGLVGVAKLGQRPPPGEVWVTNLLEPASDGRYPLKSVPRDEFEEIVLGSGRSSKFTLPEGLELPDVAADREGPIIVYKTSWCGVCKKLEAYLDRKGVQYVAKDIEKDREAAAELAAKAKQAGVPTGSVPMIDVGGELLRGFDRERLEALL
ncbi:glutaredoxin domain-containing protein [Nannocystaceae bacterium ST9]